MAAQGIAVEKIDKQISFGMSTDDDDTIDDVFESPREHLVHNGAQLKEPDLKVRKDIPTNVASSTGYRGYTAPSSVIPVQDQKTVDHTEGILHKTILVGDSGVGKTSLLVQFDTGKFQPGTFAATVGIGFSNKVLTVDGDKVKLQIWDTAGQERFRSVTHAYYRDAHALLLLYDVTSRKSFENTRAWLAEISEYAHPDVIIMLLGNKCDCHERTVKKEDGERLANEYNVNFMETSAKTGLNVEQAFTEVARALKNKRSTVSNNRAYEVKEYVEENQWLNKNSCTSCNTS